jgi:hypothetical protein
MFCFFVTLEESWDCSNAEGNLLAAKQRLMEKQKQAGENLH